jgi:hypothetical protein
MNYHTVIAVEKRISTVTAPRQLAIPITSGAVSTGVLDANGLPVIDTSTQVEELHSMGTAIQALTNPNLIYCAEWDGVADHVTVLKGSMVGLNMQYAGWPDRDTPVRGVTNGLL